jgi:hypothetical protein
MLRMHPTGYEQSAWRLPVDTTEVVTPDQIEVLDIVDSPEMILVAAPYPFNSPGGGLSRSCKLVHIQSINFHIL